MLKYMLFILIIIVSSCDDKKAEKTTSDEGFACGFVFYPQSIKFPTGKFSFDSAKCNYLPTFYAYPFYIKITSVDGTIFERTVTVQDNKKIFRISNSTTISFPVSIVQSYFQLFRIDSTEDSIQLSIEINSSIMGSIMIPMQTYFLNKNNGEEIAQCGNSFSFSLE